MPLEVTVVLPVHDEEALLESTVRGLVSALGGHVDFEILLCENGSRDRTPQIASALADELPEVRLERLPVANYGEAIRAGVERARADHVVVLNADLWDAEFVLRAHELLRTCDVVVASKRHPESLDDRPWARRALTAVFTTCLNRFYGYRGTDTHGMKALRRAVALATLPSCVSSNELLDSELVIRIQRGGGAVVEVPVAVREVRPSRQSVLARVPHTLRDMGRLALALRRSA